MFSIVVLGKWKWWLITGICNPRLASDCQLPTLQGSRQCHVESWFWQRRNEPLWSYLHVWNAPSHTENGWCRKNGHWPHTTGQLLCHFPCMTLSCVWVFHAHCKLFWHVLCRNRPLCSSYSNVHLFLLGHNCYLLPEVSKGLGSCQSDHSLFSVCCNHHQSVAWCLLAGHGRKLRVQWAGLENGCGHVERSSQCCASSGLSDSPCKVYIINPDMGSFVPDYVSERGQTWG